MNRIGSVILLLTILGYLGTYGGKLCIYNECKTEPIQVFPYSVTIFPKNDQTMLSNGIPYQNYEELQKLMEDYLS